MFNIVFLIIYTFAAQSVSGSNLYMILIIQFSILTIQEFGKKKISITPLAIYYIGVIIVTIGNFNFVGQLDGHHQLKIYNYIVPKYVDDAAQLWCISSVIFIYGYNYFKDRSLPSIYLDVSSKKALSTIFYFLLVLNIAQIVGYGIGKSQFGKIIGLLNSIGILFFARLWAVDENKTFRAYALLLYVLLTYYLLISSYLRFELILPTFYLFIGYFIGKREIRYLFSYRVIPVLIAFALYSSVFSQLENNRSNFIATFTHQSDNQARVQRQQEQESGGFFDRISNVAQLTNVFMLENKNGFYGGTASAPLVTALIPRFLWPNKPKIQVGAWFALEIGAGYKNEAGIINNSVNMTVPGELYLDFGWVGVILGMFLFGGFIALLWNSTHFYTSEYNLPGTIFGGYLIVISLGSYADLQIVITMMSTYLIFLAIKKIASRRNENSFNRAALARK